MASEKSSNKKTHTRNADLTAAVQDLADATRRQSRIRRRFYSGIVFGLGSALGATLIAGLVTYSLSQIVDLSAITEVSQSIPSIEGE
jgi:hypothetical protein